jgi:hypothetical protein
MFMWVKQSHWHHPSIWEWFQSHHLKNADFSGGWLKNGRQFYPLFWGFTN